MNSTGQIIISCDEKGDFLGYIPKSLGHSADGVRHRAIDVLLYNARGQVLLQKRKHKVFDDIWDVTGATHPLHSNIGADENYQDATYRCLNREYGITTEIPLQKLGEFNYFAKYADNLCENEHCARMIGEYNGRVKLNPEVGYEYKWVDKMAFFADISANPQKYSPWAVAGNKFLIEAGFFGDVADKMQELLTIVDENDQVVGRAKRAEVFATGLLHRAVNMIVKNSEGQIFLQQRSVNKKAFPSYWDLSASEHVTFGESYEEAAKRGLSEELGLKDVVIKKIRPVHLQQSQYQKLGKQIFENELVETYQAIYDGKIKLDPKEVSDGKFYSVKQINDMIFSKKFKFTPWFLDEWKYYQSLH